ncbi:hypothetical protein [Halioxenophilus aromaticivorans]|uniref:Uncharacterized protein n=1 Tax=Halioxenophilus aromaticivorans TaxID=1306992 RepID=A0AAV3U5M2_9ALTE
MIYIFLALVLFFITYLDYRRAETDTICLLDWWSWLDVSRASMPTLFWVCLMAQLAMAIFLLAIGLKAL